MMPNRKPKDPGSSENISKRSSDFDKNSQYTIPRQNVSNTEMFTFFQNVATKQDLCELRKDLIRVEDKLEAKIDKMTTKEDLDKVDAKIDENTKSLIDEMKEMRKESKSDFRWIIATIISIGGVVFAALRFLHV